MSLLDFFRSRKSQNSASIAKERLQIIVAHERGQRAQPDYLPQLQKDLLEVIRKYVPIDQEQIQVELENQGNCSILNSTSPCRIVDSPRVHTAAAIGRRSRFTEPARQAPAASRR